MLRFISRSLNPASLTSYPGTERNIGSLISGRGGCCVLLPFAQLGHTVRSRNMDKVENAPQRVVLNVDDSVAILNLLSQLFALLDSTLVFLYL